MRGKQTDDPILAEAVELLTALNVLVESCASWGTTEQRAALRRLHQGVKDLSEYRMREAAQKEPLPRVWPLRPVVDIRQHQAGQGGTS